MSWTNTIKMNDNNVVIEIKKHSSLVQMWNIASLQERKTMNALIRIAKDMLKRYENARVFQCDIGLIRRLAGINDTSNKDLKKALKNLKRNEIEYNVLNKDERNWWIFSFLAEANIREQWRGKNTIVTFEFPTTVLNVIKNPRIYVKLDLIIIRGLESKHSVALYELMKDYQNLNRYRCEIGNFRKLMGVEEWQYKIFTMFKKRVVDKAIEEINEKTDIELSFDLEREGRKITALTFNVKNKPKKLTSHSDELDWKVSERLKQLWIKSKMITELKNKHDLEYLLANTEVVLEQTQKQTITNPTGYLLKALQNDYRPVQNSESFAPIEKLAPIPDSWGEVEISIQDKIKQLTSQIHPSEIEILKEAFIVEVQSKDIIKKILDNKGFEHPIIQGQWLKYLQDLNW